MSAVATSRNVPTLFIPAGFGSELRPEPQGNAGQGLLDKADEVCRQWVEQAEIISDSIELVMADAEFNDCDEVPYASSALKPAFYVKVRYKNIGKMKSVPYPFDD